MAMVVACLAAASAVLQQPGSQAFHGDELPLTEGDAATRAWIVNPALGSPTLSTRNIEPTKAAIERYKAIVAQAGWPTVPARRHAASARKGRRS